MIRQQIEQAIKEALAALGAGDAVFVVERPSSFEHGDYSTNAALAAAKFLKKSPHAVAEELAAKLLSQKSSEVLAPEDRSLRQTFVQGASLAAVEKIEVAGAGFINFFLSREAVTREVEQAVQKEDWGTNGLYAGKTMLVEYTDPNPFKPFHIGHLMSNTVGEAIARVLEHSGARVMRANYQGDVGPHVAKAIYVLLKQGATHPSVEEIGAAYVEGNTKYEENPETKKEIDAINKKIYEQSDESINALYEWGRRISLQRFEELYQMLGTTFDFYFFESETAPVGLEIVKAHREIFEESDGATVFKGEQYGLHTRVFVTSQGLPTYEAKEIGLAKVKQESCPFDTSITITAQEQEAYFTVVFKAIELLFPEMVGKILHRSHGMMRLTSGKMSSRKGNVVTGESLLLDIKEQVKEKMGDRLSRFDSGEPESNLVAEQVAVAAIKYTVLKQGSGKDIVFDAEKSLSLEGDSGPYLQYAHTRALSLVKAAGEAGIIASGEDALSPASGQGGNASESASSARTSLERTLIHFPDVLLHAAQELEPHFVTTYLTELAGAFNSWYASERLIGGPSPRYSLLLAQAVERTLAVGLNVLGIPIPERM